MLAGQNLLDYTNLFSPNSYKKIEKLIYKYLKINMIEEASLEFRFKKTDKTRNYFSFCICFITFSSCWLSIIKKNKKKHNKTVLLSKDKLNTVEVLILKL